MVCTIHAFLDFCYIAQCDVHDTTTLVAFDDALQQFHHHHEIFWTTGICTDFYLPRQLSLIHYLKLIQEFGALNSICSLIMESKHIKAIKEPWCCSSRFEALKQMLLTNQCIDKLAASHADFAVRGMLNGTCLSLVLDQIHSMCFII